MNFEKTALLRWIHYAFLCGVAATCLGMGTGGEASRPLRPTFKSLEEGEGNYDATIVSNGKSFHVDHISFDGKTAYEGVGSNEEKNTITIDFSKIRSVEITAKDAADQPYGADFVEVTVILKHPDDPSKDGKAYRNRLLPSKLNISAHEKGGTDLAWHVEQIEKIIIHDLSDEPVIQPTKTQAEEGEPLVVRAKGIGESVVSVAEDAASAVTRAAKRVGSAAKSAYEDARDYLMGAEKQ